jgi:hypothetical protein
MAQRRMFSLKIVDSDAFMDMPQSSQLLYFHLSMRADDDGFVGNHKKIMRMVGSSDDDIKVLFAKRFLLSFESGILVIKHWKIHNYIQNDRYTETQYLDEKKSLITKENGSYTECIQNVSTPYTQVRLGKVRLGKDNTYSEETSHEIPLLIEAFKVVNLSYKKWFADTTQRKACKNLIESYGLDKLFQIIKLLPQSNKQQFFPVITTPLQLEEKYSRLESAFIKYKNKEPIIL